MCLLNCTPQNLTKDIYKCAASYMALGELKGGIDPAGADEHWKTARTALSRIHEAFARNLVGLRNAALTGTASGPGPK